MKVVELDSVECHWVRILANLRRKESQKLGFPQTQSVKERNANTGAELVIAREINVYPSFARLLDGGNDTKYKYRGWRIDTKNTIDNLNLATNVCRPDTIYCGTKGILPVYYILGFCSGSDIKRCGDRRIGRKDGKEYWVVNRMFLKENIDDVIDSLEKEKNGSQAS